MDERDPTEVQKIGELSQAISDERDCDIIVFNFGIEDGFEYHVFDFLNKRHNKKSKLLLILTTEGGNADSTFRIARRLQDNYSDITIVVPGWCKSAGTLLCISANNLIICDCGELGPLDIQIAKYDELGERSSGLLVGAAFEKLQEESFRLFIFHLTDIKEKIGGRITFRTAADIAAQLVIGVTSDIFAKFDPLSIGEDYRANLVAGEYAARLNLKARNVREDRRADGFKMLLRGYPSHGFVIDREEAKRLFKNVSSPEGHIAELITLLGMGVILPRSAERNEAPRLEFLNADKSGESKSKDTGKGPQKRRKSVATATIGVEDIRGYLSPSVGEDPRKSAAE